MKPQIIVSTLINAPVEKVWKYFTEPEHITKWCQASKDWHAPKAENDLRIDGKFKTRMEAKDGSTGFDFEGTYTNVKEDELIEYNILGDNRKVKVEFIKENDGCKIVETFDPENENPIEMQRSGWQAILDSFKKYAEEN